MAIGTTLSRVTGLGRLVAMAFALGIAESRLADSYNIANVLPNIVYELVLGGVLSSVFLPLVVEQLRTRSCEEADEAISAMASVAMATLVVVGLAVLVAAPWIVRLFTFRLPAAQAAEQEALATFFLRCFVPQLFFYGAAAIGGGLLNAHHRFAAPSFAPILNNIVVIATFVAFAVIVGDDRSGASVGDDIGARLLLGLGTTAGVATMAIAYLPSVRRLPVRLRPHLNLRHPAVANLARLSGWTVGYVVANQIGLAVLLVLANGVQGGPTAFFTGFAFFQLPYGIAAASIVTALIPRLATHAVDGDRARMGTVLTGGIRNIGLFMLPATAMLLALARPLVSVVLEHGIVTEASGDLVAGVIRGLAIGLLPFSVYLLLVRTLYAMKNSRTPMLVNLAANSVLVVGAIALYPALEVGGLALAHSASYLVGAALVAVAVSRRLGRVELAPTVDFLVRVAGASAASAIAAWLVTTLTDDALLQLVLGGTAGAVTLLAVARVAGIDDLAIMRKLVSRLRP